MVKLQVFGNISKTVSNIKNLTWGKNDQHIKIYLPCNFEVYTGKDFYPNPDGDEEDKQLGHSYKVVLGLLRNNNLLGKGYTY
jgi:hypothetical protein